VSLAVTSVLRTEAASFVGTRFSVLRGVFTRLAGLCGLAVESAVVGITTYSVFYAPLIGEGKEEGGGKETTRDF
jgi:hypothetical protein